MLRVAPYAERFQDPLVRGSILQFARYDVSQREDFVVFNFTMIDWWLWLVMQCRSVLHALFTKGDWRSKSQVIFAVLNTSRAVLLQKVFRPARVHAFGGQEGPLHDIASHSAARNT